MRYRNFIIASILILLVIATYFLGQRLISQLYFLKGKNYLLDSHYGLAITCLQKAVQYDGNDYITWNHLGRAYHRICLLQKGREALLTAERSKQAYLKAAKLNVYDAEAAFGLAREEARLERLYAGLHPDQNANPYEPLPYFQEAIRLRPNGIGYHYAFVRYLHWKGKTQALLPLVTDLARIYPPVYNHLKKEAFWTPEVKEAVNKGLGQAVDEGISVENAHMALSALLTQEKDWTGAISHYKKALEHRKVDLNSGHYLHLGRLYLENRQLQEAQVSFLNALAISKNREGDIKNIFRAYKAEGHHRDLFGFYQQVNTQFSLPARTDILLARTLIDREQHDEARRILNQLNQKEPNAEAFYWLFRIAQKKNDLDAMELFIQKATVLDSRNSHYHLLFSQVLNRVNKLDRAEKEAGLAIQHAAKPSLGLFNHRASIRWKLEDYQSAAEDWKSALALQPRNAAMHARLAEAYLKIGDLQQATIHYQKALQLKPNSMIYQQKLEVLNGALRTDLRIRQD